MEIKSTRKNEAMGIDIGNVIINFRLTDKNDKILYEEHYSTIPATEGVFDAVKKLNDEKFHGNIFNDFYAKTGVKPENVLFCRERHEKDKICKDNNIKYFIDDRLEVLSHMVNTAPHLFLYQPDQAEIDEYRQFLPKVIRVESWAEVVQKIK
jgi:regulator of replication initiation timing